jgi:hypothetical protein
VKIDNGICLLGCTEEIIKQSSNCREGAEEGPGAGSAKCGRVPGVERRWLPGAGVPGRAPGSNILFHLMDPGALGARRNSSCCLVKLSSFLTKG